LTNAEYYSSRLAWRVHVQIFHSPPLPEQFRIFITPHFVLSVNLGVHCVDFLYKV
jgi:hypothetical protein